MIAKPTPDQIIWQDRELGMFIHFGLYTFRDRTTWNLPGDPSVFNPTKLDAAQWVDVAQSLGARYVVFTAKHADGFCLWQTDTTDFGVRRSSWKGGEGDVVEEVTRACRSAGIDFGVYLSPADHFHGAGVGGRVPDQASQAEYDVVYRTQLAELLTRYGEICEVWFDGSCVTEVGDILSRFAPNAMVFQSSHATIRWVGNEAGYAPYPAWNAVTREDGQSGMATAAHGDAGGDLWLPLEVDTTIRDHFWMWEPGSENSLKSLDNLMEIYYRSVGYGAVLLLNSNPDTSGLIPEQDARRAAEFGKEICRRFTHPAAETNGSGNNLILDLGSQRTIDHVVCMECIDEGEAVRGYTLRGLSHGTWRELCCGTAIGHKKIDFFPPVEVNKIQLDITSALGNPAIRKLAAYSCGDFPHFNVSDIVIHDPFLVGTWGEEVGVEWETVVIDLQTVCIEARQYVCEVRPSGESNIEVQEVELLHEGEKTEGYVTHLRNGNRWNLNISAYNSDYALRITLRQVDLKRTGGKIYIR